ncbi:APC family permease [Streptomyces sp. NPDC092296]|uniref:APC family permease n=1 Tax=Streptomyces sp. NPDC092296 TaxID=3366012 RepID=UPI0038217EA4
MLTGSEPSPRTTASKAPAIKTYRGEEQALRAGRIGTPGLLLSVLAASAPMMVVAGVMPTTYAVMGIVAQPLLYVILGVVLALFSVGYAEMSRHVHNAGAFYAYISRGLGGTAGTGAAFVALIAYAALQVGIYGIFGFQVSSLFETFFHTDVVWWVPSLAAVALVAVLGALKIDLNARVLGVLLMLECLSVFVVDIAFVSDPGPEGVTFHALNPSTLTGAGLGTALCFVIAGFTGFEQAPVYAEETSRPHVVVSRVMFSAIGFTAVFFALSSWAMGVATGPSKIVGASQEASAGLIFGLSADRLGSSFSDVLGVFFATGIFASMLSFHNVVARYAFAMGREGLLPSAVGRASRTSGAPAFGSLLQTVIALCVVSAFALTGKDPVDDLFIWMGNVGALGVLLLMATSSLAVVVFFVRRGAVAAQGWRLAAATVAGIALTVIMVYAVVDFDMLLGSDPDSALRWVLPGVIAIAAVGGLVYGLLLRFRRPAVHARIGLGHEAYQLELAAQRQTTD